MRLIRQGEQPIRGQRVERVIRLLDEAPLGHNLLAYRPSPQVHHALIRIGDESQEIWTPWAIMLSGIEREPVIPGAARPYLHGARSRRVEVVRLLLPVSDITAQRRQAQVPADGHIP